MSGAERHDEWDDYEGFDDVIELLRSGPIELDDAEPSAAAWAGIAAELGFESDLAATADAAQTTPGGGTSDVGDTDATIISLSDRRVPWGRPAALATLAAAVVLLLAVPVALALRSGDDIEVIAAADLDVLDGQPAVPVRAEVVSIDGALSIDVDAPLEAQGDDFLELWLLEVDEAGVADLVSLGRVDGSGRYGIPEGVDLDTFSVVDISVEPNDGNPEHSGASVVRGELA